MYKVEVSNNVEIIDINNVKNIPVRNKVLFDSSSKIYSDELPAAKTIPLAAATIGLNNTVIPIDINDKFPHFWTDIDVQEHFLKSKPTCYVIIGQPGVGVYSLGEAMEEKYKCIHVCPRNIIRDEQQLNSNTWRTIDFNLRQNRVLSCDYILEMMKRKLMSPAVIHRGYVISGIPLINSCKATTENLPKMYSEIAVLAAQNIFEELLNDAIEKVRTYLKIRKMSSEDVDGENVAEGQEIVSEGPQEPDTFDNIFDPCHDVILKCETNVTISSFITNQIIELFKLEMNADFVIYVNCPYKDLVCKRKHKFFNYVNSTDCVLPFNVDLIVSDIRWPPEYIMSDLPSDYKTDVFQIDHITNYNCRQPINFTKNISNQIYNYKELSLPIIEKELLNYSSNFILKLDGRVSLTKLIYTIQEKLILMLIKPVLIPSPLQEFKSYNFDVEAELDSELSEFWSMVHNLNLTNSGNLKFNLRPSIWFNRCPVELRYGRVVKGKVKYAVTLFNNVYLLSSRQAYSQFLKNPRPFLKLKYLQPTCRIAVIGSKSSGKSMTSECLAWLLDGQVIDYDNLYNNECNKKRNSVYESVLLKLSPQIEEARLEEWSTLESVRSNNLDQWLKETYNYVKTFEITDFKNGKALENEEKVMFSFLTDPEEVNRVLANKSILLKYAPDELLSPISKPDVCTIEQEDVKLAIIRYIDENNLQEELEPTTKELVYELGLRISDLEGETEKITNGEKKYGNWILDGVPMSLEIWNELIESKLLPDYIITIIETREIDKENMEILSAYKSIENSKKIHSERFMVANDPLLSIKKLIKPPPQLDSIRECNKLLDDIIQDSILTSESKNSNETDKQIEEEINFYNQTFSNFKEQWDALKELLNGVKNSYIEVEIAEKTDIQVIEDILLNLRKTYNISCIENNEEDDRDIELEELKSNRFLGDTGPYCPVEFLQNNIIWDGLPDYSLKYNNKIYNFSTEQNMLTFKRDPTNIQDFCHPFKKLPPLRICIIGCLSSGRSTVSKQISKELGLLHIDFSLIVNYLLIPPHCKKVGRQFENIILDVPYDDEPPPKYEEETENEFLENLTDENIRKIVYNYFENNAPLPRPLLRKIITKIWFKEPYMRTGFVLDGFPRLPSDLEEMLLCHTRPDIVLQLDLELDDCMNRLAPNSFKTWKKQLKLAKINSSNKYDAARDKWLKIFTKVTVVKLIYEEIEKNVFKIPEDFIEHVPSEHSDLTESHLSGILNTGEDIFNVYNEVIQEFPEPVNEDEWENEEDAKNRIEQRIEILYGNEAASLESLRDIMSERRLLFASIDAARRVPVPDDRFDYLCEYHKPLSKVPAFLNVVDIAGLVKGAAEGQGLGNAFLSHIKACDAIFNLCRVFEDEDVIHVDGEVNPVRDLETIGEELRLKDEEILMQNLDKLDRVVARGGDKKLKPEFDSLQRIKAVLVDEKKHIRFGDWSAADIEILNKYLFITSKPALYLVNLSEKDYIRKKNKWLPKLKEWIDKNDPGAPLIPFSGVLETKLLDMTPDEAKNYLKENNITSALDKIIVQGYKALQLEYFFTAGPDEVKAWTVLKGTKAPQAAGRIHTDFEKGFIMAEVMHYKDFKEEGSEAACKSAGKYRQQGRNYVVEDGDVIFFKFNAGAGLKDPKKK